MPTFNDALALFRRGERVAALSAATRALAATPSDPNLLNLLVELHAANGDPASASRHAAQAAVLCPDDAAAQRRLGQYAYAAGDRATAIDAYRRAIRLDSRNARAYNNLGNVLEADGARDEAIAAYRHAIEIDPGYALAHSNLATVLGAGGDHQGALKASETALGLRVELAPAWRQLAVSRLELRDLDGALVAADRATQLAAADPRAWFVRCRVLSELDRLEDALRDCERALRLGPDVAEVEYARALLLLRIGESAAATAGFERAVALRPGFDAARMSAAVARIPRLALTMEEVEVSRIAYGAALDALDSQLQAQPCTDPVAMIGAQTPFYLAYQPFNNRDLMARYGRLCATAMQRMPASTSHGRSAGARRERLRVGIVSAHVCDHSVYVAITRGWLMQLDRARVELDVYQVGGKSDALTAEACRLADHFETGRRDVAAWQEIIGSRAPDVLLYPELGMDATTFALASLRLARRQAVSWGHPQTSGLPTMDCYLSAERFEPHDGDRHYTEALVRLAHLGSDYAPVDSAPPPEAEPRADTAPLFVCPGTPFKYAPAYDSALVAIARRVPRGRFAFFTYRDGALSRRLQARLASAFAAAGIDPAGRLVLLPWASPAKFRQILSSGVAMLDTIGFSGFNTVMQALECGLPVVTCRGDFLRGRLGSGVLEHLGIPELVADSPDAYAAVAAELALDPLRRLRLIEQIRTALPGLYRDPRPIASLQAYLDASP